MVLSQGESRRRYRFQGAADIQKARTPTGGRNVKLDSAVSGRSKGENKNTVTPLFFLASPSLLLANPKVLESQRRFLIHTDWNSTSFSLVAFELFVSVVDFGTISGGKIPQNHLQNTLTDKPL
jgi:hypothetical protein